MTETPDNILVIEDEPDLREGLKHNLEMDGYTVQTAATGSEGLQKATQNGHAKSYSTTSFRLRRWKS